VRAGHTHTSAAHDDNMNVDTNDDNDHGTVSIPTTLDDDDLATTILMQHMKTTTP
jgi:hypothetical protein